MGKQIITRLPSAVVSQLRSSTILSNVAQVAEELVCNSLDAGSTKIEIAVDGEACHMRVEDDGCGISRDDLTLVGERHATSKLHRLDELEGGVATLGFRGEALSSLSDVSLLEITSRCRGMPNTYRKILKGGATLSIGLSGEQRTHGTTVVVKDMFYNQPVRRRLLLSSHRKILQSVKECVVRYVLIHPQVSFTVKDLKRKDILLHTKSAATLSTVLCDIFGADVFSRLQEIDYAQNQLRLTGFLSKTYHSHPSKALQYFYINGRYVLKTALHKLINSYSGKSKDSMAQNKSEEQGPRGDTTSGRHLCPAFVLNMTCALSDYDITFEPSKTLVEFKDWKPVVDFVKSILETIWGDQARDSRRGFSQAPGSASAVPVQKTSTAVNIHQHKKFKQGDASKDEIPPMALRRALVQGDAPQLRDVKKDHISKHTRAATPVHKPEKPRPPSKSSVPSASLSGKKMPDLERLPKMKRNEIFVTYPATTLRTSCDSGSDCAASPKSPWRMTPCRQRRKSDEPVEPFPAILGSDWFSKGALSPESIEQNLCRSWSTEVPLPFSIGDTSPSMPEENQYRSSSFASKRFLRSSSFASKRFLRSSSSPTDNCKSPSEPLVKKSRNPARVVRFRDGDDVRCMSPVEDTEEPRGEKWWEPDNRVLVTLPWSPMNDSIGVPGIPDTSDFLPEISRYSPELAADWEHPSHDWKWPEVGSHHSLNEFNLSSRSQPRQPRVNYFDGSDSDEPADFFNVKSCSFDLESVECLGSLETEKPDYISWKLDTEDAFVDMEDAVTDIDGTQTHFGKGRDDRNFSPSRKYQGDALHDQRCDIELDSYNPQSRRRLDLDLDTSSDNQKLHSEPCEDHGDVLPDQRCDIELESCNPQSRRRLDLDLDTSSDNQKLHSDPCEKKKPGGLDKLHQAAASPIRQTRRGYSGPPFYRPPKRHGAHVNPVNSLSTVETMGKIAEDAPVAQIESGPSRKIALETDCDTSKERFAPQKGTELMDTTTFQSGKPGEPGPDCRNQLAIQSTLSLNQDGLDKHEERIGTRQAERPLDVAESIQQTVELDGPGHCKYRSTDVNCTAVDGAELPMDTVKAMFKEWSNPCMKKDDDILDLSSGILASNIGSLLPVSITKDVLKKARVLQQVDTKFIASVSCGVLLLIDQHAADERVRLEELRKEVLGGNITKQISLLSSAEELAMTFTEQQTLQTYRQQIQDWGWRFKITVERKLPASQRHRSSSGGMCKVLISAVPSILDVKLTAADLVEYVQQLTDTQGSSTPPPAVIRLLNYKACRGAIMFGDKLLPAECNQLIDHLKQTLLCFQCAHGRPTMVPLVDIQALHKRFDYTSGSSRVGANFNSNGVSDGVRTASASRRRWHGLQPHVKPSLERAQARLAQAQGV